MIRFIVAKHSDKVYDQYIGASLAKLDPTVVASYDVCDKPGEHSNIFEKYNMGIDVVRKELSATDIVVFVHEDVRIEDPFFVQKLQMVFEQKKDVGVLGVVGCTEYTERGGWWMHAPTMLRGHVMQELNGSTNHLEKGMKGFFDDIVVVDGLLMAVRPEVLELGVRFDSQTFKHNDFYDVQFCLDALTAGFRVAVADILVHHASPGMGVYNTNWEQARVALVNKYKEQGFTFPIRAPHIVQHNVSTPIPLSMEVEL